MGALLVMAQKVVTNRSSLQSKRKPGWLVKHSVVLLGVITFTLNGCQRNPSETAQIWGKTRDVTEDLHHRLQAGIFEIGKDAFICELAPDSSWTLRMPFKQRTGAYKMARITWERGSFWVQTDDHALIVIYLDEETVFGHIQVSPAKGFFTLFQFREFPETPIRDPVRSLLGM